MKFKLALALALLAAVPPAQASYYTYGIGGMNCGAWAKYKHVPVVHDMQITWVQGFISGISIAKDISFGPGMGVAAKGDSGGVKAIEMGINTFCKQNPGGKISEAATTMAAALAVNLTAGTREPTDPYSDDDYK